MLAGNMSNVNPGWKASNYSGRTVLDGVTAMDTFTMTNATKHANMSTTYLIATAFVEDGVQVFNVTDPFLPIPGTNTTKAAAGFGNVSGDEEYDSHYPSSYENVISVCAIQCSGSWGGWATYHPTVDLASPGEGVYLSLIHI